MLQIIGKTKMQLSFPNLFLAIKLGCMHFSSNKHKPHFQDFYRDHLKIECSLVNIDIWNSFPTLAVAPEIQITNTANKWLLVTCSKVWWCFSQLFSIFLCGIFQLNNIHFEYNLGLIIQHINKLHLKASIDQFMNLKYP